MTVTAPRRRYTIALAIVALACVAIGSHWVRDSADRKQRAEARAQAVRAIGSLPLPAGITKAPRGTLCGVREYEGICLTSTMTPEQTARALAAVVDAPSKPAKGPILGKAPDQYGFTGTVAGQPVIAFAHANLTGLDRASHTLRFQGSTVSLSLASTG